MADQEQIAGSRTYSSPFEQRMAMTSSSIHIGNDNTLASENKRREQRFQQPMAKGKTSETELAKQALHRNKKVISGSAVCLGESKGSFTTSSASVHTSKPNEQAGRVTRGYDKKWKQLQSNVRVGCDQLQYETTDEYHNKLGTSVKLRTVPRSQLMTMKVSGELASNFKIGFDASTETITSNRAQFTMTNDLSASLAKQVARDASSLPINTIKKASHIPRGSNNSDYKTSASIAANSGRLSRTGEAVTSGPLYTYHSASTNKFNSAAFNLGYDKPNFNTMSNATPGPSQIFNR
jgi:hypothetical protein